MVRKRTGQEKRRLAEENGYNDDDLGIDNNPVPRQVLEYTKGKYDTQMELWIEYGEHPTTFCLVVY